MLFELNQTKHKTTVISLLNAFDYSSMGMSCLFYLLISRNWFWLYACLTLTGTLSYFLAMLLVPESPKWLLYAGRKSEAIDVLNYIAKVNRSQFRFPNDNSITFLESIIAAKQKTEKI